MPQGQGTYGSKVGRPPEVDPSFEMRGHILPGPFQQRSPLQQKLWEKGGIKKQIVDPVKGFFEDNKDIIGGLSDLSMGVVAGKQIGDFLLSKGVIGKESAVSNLWDSAGGANITKGLYKTQGFLQDAATNVARTDAGKLAGGIVSKVGPLVGPAIAIGAGYLAGKYAVNPALNWMNRGVRNVLVTGERKGTSEFKSQWGLNTEGTQDYGKSGKIGAAGYKELSKKNREEKGIKIDFR